MSDEERRERAQKFVWDEGDLIIDRSHIWDPDDPRLKKGKEEDDD